MTLHVLRQLVERTDNAYLVRHTRALEMIATDCLRTCLNAVHW